MTAFAERVTLVAKLPPSLIAFMYRQATGVSTAQTSGENQRSARHLLLCCVYADCFSGARAMIMRVEEICRTGDPDILADLRSLNSSADRGCFHEFWDVAEEIIESNSAPQVSDYRALRRQSGRQKSNIVGLLPW
jgi:hypothetical protein